MYEIAELLFFSFIFVVAFLFGFYKKKKYERLMTKLSSKQIILLEEILSDNLTKIYCNNVLGTTDYENKTVTVVKAYYFVDEKGASSLIAFKETYANGEIKTNYPISSTSIPTVEVPYYVVLEVMERVKMK